MSTISSRSPARDAVVGALLIALAGTLRVVPDAARAAEGGPAEEDCSGCTLLGSLSVAAPTLDPEQPIVGDLLTMHFPVEYRLPGGFDCGLSGTCELEGGAPYLEGSDAPTYEPETGDVVVRRRVAAAGTTSIQLRVSAMTEEQCCVPDSAAQLSDCSCYFQYARISASSPPIEVSLSSGPPGADEDGCRIGAGPEGRPAWWVLGGLLGLAIAAFRRRCRS